MKGVVRNEDTIQGTRFQIVALFLFDARTKRRNVILSCLY